MKLQVTGISHDEIVNLLSTATYGSHFFDIKKKRSDYYGTELENEHDTREDTWAKILMSGKPVYVYDYYAEDDSEFYGNHPHEWVEKEQAMRYTITIDDIKQGISSALSSTGYLAKYASDFLFGAGDFDLDEAETLLQDIVFGEHVYG